MATLKSTTLSDGTTTSLHLTDNTRSGANKPSSTGNKLYANTTSLYWEDTDLVSGGGGGGGAADKSTAGNAVSNSAASDSGATKGYRNARKSKKKQAKEAIAHAGAHAFNDRRKKKNNLG